MKKIAIQTILIITTQFCFGQYSSIDTLYYPNKQIERIIIKLENDSTTIQKRYYSQHIKFKNGVFLLGDKKENKIEAIETYVNLGENGLMQEGYSEYWHENGHKRLEVIYSEVRGNRYINQWDVDANQILISGNGVYTHLDLGIERLDSLVFEVKDSLFHGKSVRYEKDEAGNYSIKSVQYFEKNRPVGTKHTYDTKGEILIQEEYFKNPDSVLYKIFYADGQMKESGINYKDRKFGTWRYYSKSGKIEKEIEYQDGYYNGKFMEFYPNGIAKVEGSYIVIIEEKEVNLIDAETLVKTKLIKKMDTSVKNGKWIYRDIVGKTTNVEFYKNGKSKKQNE